MRNGLLLQKGTQPGSACYAPSSPRLLQNLPYSVDEAILVIGNEAPEGLLLVGEQEHKYVGRTGASARSPKAFAIGP